MIVVTNIGKKKVNHDFQEIQSLLIRQIFGISRNYIAERHSQGIGRKLTKSFHIMVMGEVLDIV